MNIRAHVFRPGRLAFAALATVALVATGTAASAATITPSPYAVKLVRAVHTCVPQPTLPRQVACVHDLAAPQPGNAVQYDLWHDVLDCLSEGWTPGRGDGGFDNDVVNACLTSRGVL